MHKGRRLVKFFTGVSEPAGSHSPCDSRPVPLKATVEPPPKKEEVVVDDAREPSYFGFLRVPGMD